jgi:putative restriction endonuclease
MREAAPGDRVFSYWEGHVRAVGTVASFGYDAPKPEEFGNAGRNWSVIGYRVDVRYERLHAPLAPRDAWSRIQPLLPAKYSPLRALRGWRTLQNPRSGREGEALTGVLWPEQWMFGPRS